MSLKRWIPATAAANILAAVLLGFGAAAGADDDRREKDGSNDCPAREDENSGRDGERHERDGDEDHDRDRRGWRRDRDRNPFADLSEEERDRVRDALKQVWEDPQLIAARKRVHEAGEAYRDALREAIGRTDPEIRDIIDEIMREKFRHDFQRGGDGSRFPMPPIADLPEDLKEPYRLALEKAGQDETLKSLREQIHKAEDREQKGELMRQAGKRFREILGEVDPRLLDALPPPPDLGSGKKKPLPPQPR